MSGWGAGLMVLLWAAVWVGALILVAWIVRGWPRGPEPGGERARDVLDQRLARGEIGIDEYRRLRDAMERPTPAAP